jgi:hypothetical protein
MGGGLDQKPGAKSLVQEAFDGGGAGVASPGKRTLTEQPSGHSQLQPVNTPGSEPSSTFGGAPHEGLTSPPPAAGPNGAAAESHSLAQGVAGVPNGQAPVQRRAAGSGAGAADAASAEPLIPAEHEGHKIKVELGSGSVTGAITLTLEAGKTGVPLAGDQLKAFKNTASLNLNGFIMKLETAVLNGKLDEDILDGVKIAVEISALKASSDGSSASMDLLTVALKLQGDVGHWLHAGPNVKMTLDGQVQIALGGKLAAKLASYTVAQLEQQMLAKEIETVGDTVAGHTESITNLKSKLAALETNPSATRREIQAIEHELFRHRIQVSTGGQQLKGLTNRLAEAKRRANTALRRLEGRFAKKVAWAMEKKTVKFLAKTLSKLLPVLNLVSTIADVIEVIHLVKALLKGAWGGEGDGEESHNKAADGAAEGNTDGAPGGASEGSNAGQQDPHEPAANQPAPEARNPSTGDGGTSSPPQSTRSNSRRRARRSRRTRRP